MTISERLFHIMREKNVSMPELSRATGISRHTIYDWQKKNTNPGADKIMVICEALQVSPEVLLIGTADDNKRKHGVVVSDDEMEMQIIREYRGLSETQKKRLLAYMTVLSNMK